MHFSYRPIIPLRCIETKRRMAINRANNKRLLMHAEYTISTVLLCFMCVTRANMHICMWFANLCADSLRFNAVECKQIHKTLFPNRSCFTPTFPMAICVCDPYLFSLSIRNSSNTISKILRIVSSAVGCSSYCQAHISSAPTVASFLLSVNIFIYVQLCLVAVMTIIKLNETRRCFQQLGFSFNFTDFLFTLVMTSSLNILKVSTIYIPDRCFIYQQKQFYFGWRWQSQIINRTLFKTFQSARNNIGMFGGR